MVMSLLGVVCHAESWNGWHHTVSSVFGELAKVHSKLVGGKKATALLMSAAREHRKLVTVL